MQVKIIVLGRFGVGKTSILHKLKNDTFEETLDTTLAIDYVSKVLEVEGREVKVQFWDTAGQEKYNNVAEQYYRKADGAIIVASCDKPVKQAVSQFQKYLNISQERDTMLPNFLLLNKRDLVDSAYLQDINKSQQDIEAFKKKYSVFDFRLVSAKTTMGIEFINLFQKFVKMIMQGKTKKAKSQLDSTSGSKVLPTSKLQAASLIETNHSGCCS